jgi:peptidase E
MPYFNSFRKTYTSVFDIKAEVALMVYGEMSIQKIADKIDMADMIYVGGGNTIFMLEKWKQCGIDKLIADAYSRGVVLCGLSAGGICWFEKMFTDGFMTNGEANEYEFSPALGYLNYGAIPHYNLRKEDFYNKNSQLKNGTWYAIENNSAVVFKNGEFYKTLSSGGQSYKLMLNENEIVENLI